VSRERILELVADLGYEPEIVAHDAGVAAQVAVLDVAISELPAEIRALFAEAKKSERPVLLDFTAPG
jgi:hypothetical protein